jgi:FlaG/FlaF family flagellin (archaellin)
MLNYMNMEIRELRGVSPVIGIILLVGISIVLAAGISSGLSVVVGDLRTGEAGSASVVVIENDDGTSTVRVKDIDPNTRVVEIRADGSRVASLRMNGESETITYSSELRVFSVSSDGTRTLLVSKEIT